MTKNRKSGKCRAANGTIGWTYGVRGGKTTTILCSKIARQNLQIVNIYLYLYAYIYLNIQHFEAACTAFIFRFALDYTVEWRARAKWIQKQRQSKGKGRTATKARERGKDIHIKWEYFWLCFFFFLVGCIFHRHSAISPFTIHIIRFYIRFCLR